jgi:hypothetical protein
MQFDLHEVQRALILATCGTAVLIGLFALFIQAQRRSDQTTRSVPSVVRTGAYLAGWYEVNGQKLGGLGVHGAV